MRKRGKSYISSDHKIHSLAFSVCASVDTFQHSGAWWVTWQHPVPRSTPNSNTCFFFLWEQGTVHHSFDLCFKHTLQESCSRTVLDSFYAWMHSICVLWLISSGVCNLHMLKDTSQGKRPDSCSALSCRTNGVVCYICCFLRFEEDSLQ